MKHFGCYIGWKIHDCLNVHYSSQKFVRTNFSLPVDCGSSATSVFKPRFHMDKHSRSAQVTTCNLGTILKANASFESQYSGTLHKSWPCARSRDSQLHSYYSERIEVTSPIWSKWPNISFHVYIIFNDHVLVSTDANFWRTNARKYLISNYVAKVVLYTCSCGKGT